MCSCNQGEADCLQWHANKGYLHVPISNGSCLDKQLICQCGLAVIYVCYDREVAYPVCWHLHNSLSVIKVPTKAAGGEDRLAVRVVL